MQGSAGDIGETTMKVEHRGGMKNKSNTAGFVNIEDFEGATMRISKKLLKQSIATIEKFDEVDMDNEYIDIGISKFESPWAQTFLIFLDVKKTLAYAVAGAFEE